MKKTEIKTYIQSRLHSGKVTKISVNKKHLIMFYVKIDSNNMFFTNCFFEIQSVSMLLGEVVCYISGENLNYFKKLIENEKINK